MLISESQILIFFGQEAVILVIEYGRYKNADMFIMIHPELPVKVC